MIIDKYMTLDQIDYDQEIINQHEGQDFFDVDPEELQERLDSDPLYQQIKKFQEDMEVI